MAIKPPTAVAALYKAAPSPQRETMLEMRLRILQVVPSAKEVIKYGMPAFEVDGQIVAGLLSNKKHVGYYPFSGSILGNFRSELKNYSKTKAALHIPVDKPIPKSLVCILVRARISQCEAMQGKSPKSPEKAALWKSLGLPAPAQRALVNAKILTIKDLKKWKEADLLNLHGFGPSSLPIVRKALKK